MMFDDEILQATFCGTNLPVNTVFQCHHPVRTDDGATAYVWSRNKQWYLKYQYALSLNRNEVNDRIYLTSSPDQWLQIYSMLYKHLQQKRRLLTGLV